MSYIKEQFTKDFIKSSNVKLTFNTARLARNVKPAKEKRTPHRPRHLGLFISLSVVGTVIALPIMIVVAAGIRIDDSVKEYKKAYSMNEIRMAEHNSFRQLNSVSYPNGASPVKSEISDQEMNAYNNFANRTYHSLVDSSNENNMSYSLVGLYSILNEMTNAASRDNLKTQLNSLLGLNENSRVAFYDKVMKANSFAIDKSTIQLKNAAFFNNEYNYNQTFVNKLTQLYCEAYQLDFDTEADRIVEWVNQAVNDRSFIDKNFLELEEDTQLCMLSTLYFKNAWEYKYLAKDNEKRDFYLASGNTVTAEFMYHVFQTKSYYDYGTYISFKDFYLNSNASVTYIVPKKVEDNIFNLTKNVNIFQENEAKKKTKENESFYINLRTPKFTTKSEISFKSSLTKLGFGDMFDKKVDSFKNAFDDPNLLLGQVYAQNIKQKNEVEFNEDGSIVKSVSYMPIGYMGMMAEMRGTLDIDLNQPFIYIIRDANDVPIFVGHIDNPSIK